MSEIDKALESAQFKYRKELEERDKSLDVFSMFLRAVTLIAAIACVFLVLNGINETKKQSLTNQNYIRCIVLLPAGSFRGTPEQRAKVIDDCAVQSQPKSTGLNIDSKDIIVTAVILSVLVLLASIVNGQRRYKKLGTKIDEVHAEVKTANSMSIAQLADADETRRIEQIPPDKQTQEEKHHTRDVKPPK